MRETVRMLSRDSSDDDRVRRQCAPVLLIVFNRPDLTARVIEAISRHRPPRLYVAADGPRNSEDDLMVALTRDVATQTFWPCHVKTRFLSQNAGCRRHVSDAIDWFFSFEEQGVILEDDCIPSSAFLEFASVLLDKYAANPTVGAIAGTSFLPHSLEASRDDSASYYFSRFSTVWGWATWRSVWALYDYEISFLDSWVASHGFRRSFASSGEAAYWLSRFRAVQRGNLDTWDYAWMATIMFHQLVVATPLANLVSNSGFRPDATHTKELSWKSDMPVSESLAPVHPSHVSLSAELDRVVYERAFRPSCVRRIALQLQFMLVAVRGMLERLRRAANRKS